MSFIEFMACWVLIVLGGPAMLLCAAWLHDERVKEARRAKYRKPREFRRRGN